ncbi:MAG: amino acid permease [Phycisphaerales bacterium]|nr:amino acid permease [Phycisphaerales bacterium]
MLVAESRPRSLSWFHAGPLLFGDWGTSRLYVLGLAFYYTGHASIWYLAVMSVIMAAVAWAYTVICRCFPEGGGVYNAARQVSPTLSVIGATLLICDYIVTAALSAVEGFHYFGTPAHLVVPLCVLTIFAIGVVNWLGARSAGRLALLIAVAAIAVSALIAILCIPMLKEGLKTAVTGHGFQSSPWERWESLVRIVLALSGVEAVANMTGLMKKPVEKTSRRTIWPVLIEVVVLNMVFGIAINALPALAGQGAPDYHTYEIVQNLPPEQAPAEVKAYRDTAMKLLSTHAATYALGEGAGRFFGIATGFVFGLLLLSAVNTAVMAMVSVQYSMAQDRELPRTLARLNYSGVPWLGLIIACILPTLVLLLEADVKALGELYAIGVVGAITINVVSCAVNKSLPIRPWERRGLWILGSLMALIELTIVVAKPNATIFAGTLIALVMGFRIAVRRLKPAAAEKLEMPAMGWLAEITREPLKQEPGRPRIMLAARGRDQAEFAVELAKKRRATLFGLYVRTLRIMDVTPGQIPRIENDPVAQETLGTVAVLARQANIPFIPIYITATDIPSEILDYTVTFGCDTLIMGKSRRTLFSRRVVGDVLAEVAKHLPDGVALITRSTSPVAADFTRTIRAILAGQPVDDEHTTAEPAAPATPAPPAARAADAPPGEQAPPSEPRSGPSPQPGR